METRFEAADKVDLKDEGRVVPLPKSTVWGARDNNVLVFNEVAASMWKWLADGFAFEDIVGQLVREYGTDRDTVASDLNGFAAALLKLGVLKERNNPSSGDQMASPATADDRKSYASPKIHIYDPESDEEQVYQA